MEADDYGGYDSTPNCDAIEEEIADHDLQEQVDDLLIFICTTADMQVKSPARDIEVPILLLFLLV